MTEIMKLEDLDPIETREWIESIDSVLKTQGAERAHFLLEQLIDYTRRSGAYLPFRPNTAYVNTISPGHEPSYPGNREFEKPHRGLHPLECAGDGAEREQGSRASTAATCLPTRPRPRFTKWASITSGARQSAGIIPATWCSCRVMPRPASTRAPSSKAGCPRTSSSISARKRRATACRPIRIRG